MGERATGCLAETVADSYAPAEATISEGGTPRPSAKMGMASVAASSAPPTGKMEPKARKRVAVRVKLYISTNKES